MLLRSFANFPTSAEVFRYDAAAALPDDPEFPEFPDIPELPEDPVEELDPDEQAAKDRLTASKRVKGNLETESQHPFLNYKHLA